MSITYTWEVTGIKTTTVANTSDVVVQTYWKKIGTDENGNEGIFNGATPFKADSIPAGSTFIPFSELTESDVLTWIKAVVVGEYENHVNGVISKMIEDKKNPIVEATLPWAPVANAANVEVSSTPATDANTANTL